MLCHVTKPLNAIFLHEVFVTALSSCIYENNLLHQINSNVGLSVVVNGTQYNSTANDGGATNDGVPAVTDPARKDTSTANVGDATKGGVPAVTDSTVTDESAVNGISAKGKEKEKEVEVVDIEGNGTAGANAKSGGGEVNTVESDISKDSRNANEGDNAKKKAEAKKSHDKSDSSDSCCNHQQVFQGED